MYGLKEWDIPHVLLCIILGGMLLMAIIALFKTFGMILGII